jgi:hypothetical protein
MRAVATRVPVNRAALFRLLAMALLALLLPASAPSTAAQVDRPCVEEAPPADDFVSPGIGLTTQELERLYGERQIGQGSIFFDFQGLDLHKVDCDLILSFPRDWEGDAQMHEFALAESLLPADAEYLGDFARGTTIRSEQSASLWWSDSLAARFAEMGADRGGAILILYTYEPAGLEQGPIQRVELRTLALPE